MNIQTLDSEQFLGSEPVDRATWLCLLRYCIGQENSGVMVDCAGWSDRKWQQLVRVTKKEAERVCDLWGWDGGTLRVWGYPGDKECEVKRLREIGKQTTEAKRAAARTNGAKGGRPRTADRGAETEADEDADVGARDRPEDGGVCEVVSGGVVDRPPVGTGRGGPAGPVRVVDGNRTCAVAGGPAGAGAEGPAPGGSSRVLETQQGTEQKTRAEPMEGKGMEMEGEGNGIPPDPPRGGLEALAEEMWELCPRLGRERSSQAQLMAQLRRLPAVVALEGGRMLVSLRAWCLSESWTREEGRFVPGIHRWVRDGKWRLVPEPAGVGKGKFAGIQEDIDLPI
ncbi:hypothetical protein GCM10023212_14030 [Luteolibacter yonseiensis]